MWLWLGWKKYIYRKEWFKEMKKTQICLLCDASFTIMGAVEEEPLLEEFKMKHKHESVVKALNHPKSHSVDVNGNCNMGCC